MGTVTRKTIIINNTVVTGTFYKQQLDPNEGFEIPASELTLFREDPTTSGAVESGDLIVSDGVAPFVPAGADAVQWFFDHPRPLRPTTINLENQTLVTLSSGVDAVGGIDYIIGSTALVGTGGNTVTSGTSTIEIFGASGAPDEDDVDAIVVSGTTMTGTITLEGQGSVSLLPDEPVANTITVSGTPGAAPGQLKNQIITIEFTGGSSNEWMAISSEDHVSNESPYIFPFPARIVALAYTNFKQSSRFQAEFYHSLQGNGALDFLEFTWDRSAPPGQRVAYKSDFGIDEVTFAAGDKMSVFLRTDTGVSPDKPVLIVYVQIADDNFDEAGENFGGNFTL